MEGRTEEGALPHGPDLFTHNKYGLSTNYAHFFNRYYMCAAEEIILSKRTHKSIDSRTIMI
jgi:hypothetical protein